MAQTQKTATANAKAPIKSVAGKSGQDNLKKRSDSSQTLRGMSNLDIGVHRKDSFQADPLLLHVEEGFNKRIVAEGLREHIDSIKEAIKAHITRNDPEERKADATLEDVIGTLVIYVNDGVLKLVDGHCRATAIRELIAEGWIIELVRIYETKTNHAGRVALMLRTGSARELRPIERAMAFVELADDGLSFPDISRVIGGKVTPQRVEQLVLLGRAPESVRSAVIAGDMTADRAIEILRKHREDPSGAASEVEGLVQANDSNKPVGRSNAVKSKSIAVPAQAAQGIYGALAKDASALNKAIQKIEASGKEDWAEEPVTVHLPAGIVKELLERHAKEQERLAKGDGGADSDKNADSSAVSE